MCVCACELARGGWVGKGERVAPEMKLTTPLGKLSANASMLKKWARHPTDAIPPHHISFLLQHIKYIMQLHCRDKQGCCEDKKLRLMRRCLYVTPKLPLLSLSKLPLLSLSVSRASSSTSPILLTPNHLSVFRCVCVCVYVFAWSCEQLGLMCVGGMSKRMGVGDRLGSS